MKEIVVLVLISALFFISFIVTLTVGIIRKNKHLILTALLFLISCIASGAWTGFRLLKKSYHKVTETLKPRTGNEIYNALFGSDKNNCAKVTDAQDEIIPGLDDGIWLRFEPCPSELSRILSIHEFILEKQPTHFAENIEWIDPDIMGDTVLVFKYHDQNQNYMQTLWTSTDSTKVVCQDIYY